MSSEEINSFKERVAERPALSIVYPGLPLNLSQRPCMPTINESKEASVSKIIEEKENFQVNENVEPCESSIPSFTISQSALDAFSPVKFNTKTTTDEDDEAENVEKEVENVQKDEILQARKSLVPYSCESSILSALDVSNETKKSTVNFNDKEKSKIGGGEKETSSKKVAEAYEAWNRTLKDPSVERMEVDDPPLIPKISVHARQETAQPIFDRAIFAEHPKEKDLQKVAAVSNSQPIKPSVTFLLPSSNQSIANADLNSWKSKSKMAAAPSTSQKPPRSSAAELLLFLRKSDPKAVAAPSTSQSTKSRLAYLLPSSKQSTANTATDYSSTSQPKNAASISHSRPMRSCPPLRTEVLLRELNLMESQSRFQPSFSISSASNKIYPPFHMYQNAHQERRSNQRPRFTPRKNSTIIRSITDQSFHAAKVPFFDVSKYDGIPRAKPLDTHNLVLHNKGKRAHSVTPQRSRSSSASRVSNKTKSNQSCLSHYESPVSSRVAPKRFASSSPSNKKASVEVAENVSPEVVLQTPSPLRENVFPATNDSNLRYVSDIQCESPQESIAVNDSRHPSTAVKDFTNVELHEDNGKTVMDDSHAANVSALIVDPKADENDEQDLENLQPLSSVPVQRSSVVDIVVPNISSVHQAPQLPPIRQSKRKKAAPKPANNVPKTNGTSQLDAPGAESVSAAPTPPPIRQSKRKKAVPNQANNIPETNGTSQNVGRGTVSIPTAPNPPTLRSARKNVASTLANNIPDTPGPSQLDDPTALSITSAPPPPPIRQSTRKQVAPNPANNIQKTNGTSQLDTLGAESIPIASDPPTLRSTRKKAVPKLTNIIPDACGPSHLNAPGAESVSAAPPPPPIRQSKRKKAVPNQANNIPETNGTSQNVGRGTVSIPTASNPPILRSTRKNVAPKPTNISPDTCGPSQLDAPGAESVSAAPPPPTIRQSTRKQVAPKPANNVPKTNGPSQHVDRGTVPIPTAPDPPTLRSTRKNVAPKPANNVPKTNGLSQLDAPGAESVSAGPPPPPIRQSARKNVAPKPTNNVPKTNGPFQLVDRSAESIPTAPNPPTLRSARKNVAPKPANNFPKTNGLSQLDAPGAESVSAAPPPPTIRQSTRKKAAPNQANNIPETNGTSQNVGRGTVSIPTAPNLPTLRSARKNVAPKPVNNVPKTNGPSQLDAPCAESVSAAPPPPSIRHSTRKKAALKQANNVLDTNGPSQNVDRGTVPIATAPDPPSLRSARKNVAPKPKINNPREDKPLQSTAVDTQILPANSQPQIRQSNRQRVPVIRMNVHSNGSYY